MDVPLAFILLPLDSANALYAVLFLILLSSGLGLPVPEEITLVVGGYLSYLGFLSFWPTIYLLITGIVVADLMGYLVGRWGGEWAAQKIGGWRLTSVLLKKAEWYFSRHGEKMVIFSRPLVGIRVAVPILAGHFRMNFAKFLIFDVLTAIPWTIFLVSLSYYLGSGLDLITDVREIKHGVFIGLGVVILVLAGVKFLRALPPTINNRPNG